MRKLDDNERRILRELIKNPRISDNKIGKITGIPVMTVNRKRNALEKEGVLNYYASIKKHSDGLEIFSVRQLYIIKLKSGTTRTQYVQQIESDPGLKLFNCTYISSTFLGEKDGHLAIILIIDASTDAKLIEEFNGKIVPALQDKFGEDAIREVITTRINETIRMHHNYLPNFNVKNGKIKEDWPNDLIFIDTDPKKDKRLFGD
jgi:DNA-binding Lrp family transcriptional regulator